MINQVCVIIDKLSLFIKKNYYDFNDSNLDDEIIYNYDNFIRYKILKVINNNINEFEFRDLLMKISYIILKLLKKLYKYDNIPSSTLNILYESEMKIILKYVKEKYGKDFIKLYEI